MASPRKRKKRGTYVIDLLIPGIGRLKRASGTTDVETFKDIKAMIRKLVNKPRLDILLLLKTGELSFLKALDHYNRDDLDRIPVGKAVLPVAPEWEEYLKVRRGSEKMKRDIGYTLTMLIGRGNAARSDLTIDELPGRLEALIAEKAEFPPTCAKVKAHVQGFLKARLGSNHPIYALVRNIVVPERNEPREPPLLSPDDVRDLISRMRLGGADVWSLCITGMLPNREYHLDWKVEGATLHIPGKKRKNRKRDIPLFGTVTRPSVHPRTLADAVREASDGTVQAKDFRNCFGRWCLMAGIDEFRVEQYMGHRAQTETRRYARGVPRPSFIPDVAKFQAYVGDPPIFQESRMGG